MPDTMHEMSDDDFMASFSSGSFQNVDVIDEDVEATEEVAPAESNDEEVIEEVAEEVIETPEEEVAEPEETDEESSEEETQEEEDTSEEDTLDWSLIAKPFKANGKDFQVNTPEEALRLMSMGANYNKKMATMKPHLKMIQMLENNQLLDEDKISNLIDLAKHDKSAIAKLIKDSEINPLDIDVEEDSKNYTPKNHKVSDQLVDLKGVLADMKLQDKGSETVEAVTSMDNASQDALLSNPNNLEIIRTHMVDGTYDRIMAEVNRQQVLGSMKGASDIQAYDYVWRQIQAGAMPKGNHEANVDTPEETSQQVRNKRKQVKPKKGTKPVKKTDDSNAHDLSDDDFEKWMAKHME